MKYTIINAYGRSNRGDSVLLDECIDEIQKFDKKANIACALFHGLDDAFKVYPNICWSERIGNRSKSNFMGRIKSILYIVASYIGCFKCLGVLHKLLPKNQQLTITSIKNSDVVISCPGGYIHDTNYAYLLAIFQVVIAQRLRKKVILAPQSYGPINSLFGKLLIGCVIRRCDAVCTRELYSHEFIIEQLGIPKNKVFRCGDSALWNYQKNNELPVLDGELYEIINKDNILGITVVGWNFPNTENPKYLYDRYTTALSEIVDNVCTKLGLIPVIYNQVDGDIDTALIVKSKCRTHVFVDQISREPEYLRPMIARSTVFLGTRFHSCIFAMMANVPTVAISYLPKTTYILKDLNLPDRSTDICDIDVELIIKKIEMDYNNLDKSKAELSHAIYLYQSKYLRLSDVLNISLEQ